MLIGMQKLSHWKKTPRNRKDGEDVFWDDSVLPKLTLICGKSPIS